MRVVELGTLLAGPFAGRLLGDMGAEVIKVEAPGMPDPLRDWGRARYEGRTLWWPVQSRNKKCITLNLREPRGQELLLELVRVADVVTENFRPGTLERWNCGYEQLSDEPPPRAGISLGDSLAAMFAVQGILAALYRRDVLGGDGRWQVVDVSLMEASFALLESTVPEYDRLGVVRGPTGTGLKGIAPSNIFKSRDDLWIVIAANQDTVFRRLCDAIGRPELADDARFATHLARGDNQEAIEEVVAEWAARHDAHEIYRVLNDAGVVCGPIYTVAEIFDDPQFRAREMLVEHVDPEFGPYIGPGIVPKFSATPGAIRWSGTWEEGSHNEDVYCGLLGLTATEVDELRKAGVV